MDPIDFNAQDTGLQAFTLSFREINLEKKFFLNRIKSHLKILKLLYYCTLVFFGVRYLLTLLVEDNIKTAFL